MSRLNNYCVTVVEQPDPVRVLAAFGADLDTAVRGDARDELGLYSLATGYRPVVRVVEHGQWCVAVESFSFEGMREPVLRRLSAASRVVSVSLDHIPEYKMGFAELGDVIGPFQVPRRSDAGWHQLDAVADRVGVSLENWSDERRMRSAVEFAGDICGFPIDDGVVASPGTLGVILPLLPVSFAESGSVRSDIDAQIVALAESGSCEELAPAVSEQVRAMLADVGISSSELLDALAEPSGVVEDDSPVGQALRRVVAEQWLISGPPVGSRGRNVDVRSVDARVSAGLTAAALLRSGPRAAVAKMLDCRPGSEWRSQLIAGWEGVVATPKAIEAAAARLATHMSRRARSISVPGDRLPGREQAAERTRAVPYAGHRPASAAESDRSES
ncbi:hypothetical protein GC106_29520 [Kibdelosporangium sp. 4NS15]|uniref:DUF4192 domain-containing protein n=1 Tax=Kibdelosporangium persicum TaxID=2698649 RepID=A0ABX2F3B6_9PSEU|nr:DUF6461 domain-containing protein [Kibdelosporangium persicum]NRN65737.1 hypothetical protein [Kibdelosporangium persicum]